MSRIRACELHDNSLTIRLVSMSITRTVASPQMTASNPEFWWRTMEWVDEDSTNV